MALYTGIQVRPDYKGLSMEETRVKHKTDITHQIVVGLTPHTADALALRADAMGLKPVVLARTIIDMALQTTVVRLRNPVTFRGFPDTDNPEFNLNDEITNDKLLGNNRGTNFNNK